MRTIPQVDTFRDLPRDAGTLGVLLTLAARPIRELDDELDIIRRESFARWLAPCRAALIEAALRLRGCEPLS